MQVCAKKLFKKILLSVQFNVRATRETLDFLRQVAAGAIYGFPFFLQVSMKTTKETKTGSFLTVWRSEMSGREYHRDRIGVPYLTHAPRSSPPVVSKCKNALNVKRQHFSIH